MFRRFNGFEMQFPKPPTRNLKLEKQARDDEKRREIFRAAAIIFSELPLRMRVSYERDLEFAIGMATDLMRRSESIPSEKL